MSEPPSRNEGKGANIRLEITENSQQIDLIEKKKPLQKQWWLLLLLAHENKKNSNSYLKNVKHLQMSESSKDQTDSSEEMKKKFRDMTFVNVQILSAPRSRSEAT